MKEFLKNNITLVLGVSLPVLLVFFLVISSNVSRVLVAPPTYKLIYAKDYRHWHQMNFDIIDDKLHLIINPCQKNCARYMHMKPKLYLFDPETQTSIRMKLELDFWQEDGTVKYSKNIVESTKYYKLDDSLHAPDGYIFETKSRRLFSGYTDKYQNRTMISKYGNNVDIADITDSHGTEFIGWVISEDIAN